MQRRSFVVVLLAVSLVWGSGWIANEALAEVSGPVHIAFWCYICAFVAAATWYGLRQLLRYLRRPIAIVADVGALGYSSTAAKITVLNSLDSRDTAQSRSHGLNLLLGCTMFAFPELLLVAAAKHGAAAYTPLIYAGLPLGLSLVEGALRIDAILGVGAMVFLLNGSFSLAPAKLLWALAIVAAVALQGWSLVLVQRNARDCATVKGFLLQMMGAAMVLQLGIRILPESTVQLPMRAWPVSSLLALGAVAVLATAVAYPLYYRLLAIFKPSQIAVSTWLQTLVAISQSVVLMRQRPAWPMFAAAAVLVVCATLMVRSSNSEPADDLHFTPG